MQSDVEITFKNSTVGGSDWPQTRFAALDFSVELYSDDSYRMGCLKYVPCLLDDDFKIGHRVRSKYPDAKPVHVNGKWLWRVDSIQRHP
jgi:hypothetical protein